MAIIKFEATPVDAIAPAVESLRKTFNSQKTKSIEFRLLQLRKLYWSIKDHSEAIVEALKHDIGKPTFETYLSEIDWLQNDIVFVDNNLRKWARDESAPDIAWANKLLAPIIRKEPLGCVLVIGAYNFPLQLSIGPCIGAIAAGNTVVLKPSEQCPSAAMIIEKLFAVLDPNCYKVIQGGIPETTALLDQKWDKIFYTGSATVGKIIAKKAAETLTPVTLELGGKNPAIVTRNADVHLAARRLLWGKIHNAGQVCVSQNYILVDREVFPTFVSEMKMALKEFYPSGIATSEDYGRIATLRGWQRLKKMLDESNGTILMGGTMDEATRFFEPTVVEVTSQNDSLIVEESFGPLIPILVIDDLDQAIRIANEVDPTPLGAYPFGNKAETDQVLAHLTSGGSSVNDAWFHCCVPTLAFGGVGQSGSGAYRGRLSFDNFSHHRSIVKTPGWMEGLIGVRYPPYEGKLAKIRQTSALKPQFDRQGKASPNWIGWLFSLGAESKKSAMARYAILLLVAISLKRTTKL